MTLHCISKTVVFSTVIAVLAIIGLIVAICTTESLCWQFFLAFLVLVLLYPLTRVPIRSTQEGSIIHIRQLIGHKEFDLRHYESKAIALHQLGGVIRAFGSSAWCYVGIFYSKRMGFYHALHMSNKNLLLLTHRKSGKRYVIDVPDDV